MMKKLKPTAEERQLGLDPNLYSKKKVNPEDYMGYSEKHGLLKNKINQLRQDIGMPSDRIEGLEADQSMSDEEIKAQLDAEALAKAQLMLKAMKQGVDTPLDEQEKMLRMLENKPMGLPPKRK